MIYIDADHLSDGLYNVKDGKIYKYKAKGGTVRTYELRNIVRCGECKRANYEWSGVRCGLSDALMGEGGFCSIGERSRR